MTRWMRPPELLHGRARDHFDPIVAGSRYGLSRELSLAIWERVSADAADSADRYDAELTQRRFHELAARIRARGGRIRPDPGKVTRVGVEVYGDSPETSIADELRPRVPGRETLNTTSAQRQMEEDGRSTAEDAAVANKALSPRDAGTEGTRHEVDEYRVLGLRTMLQRLGPNHRLRREIIAASADPVRSLAGAAPWREPPSDGPMTDGHVLWRVTERHAATLYRRAVNSGAIDRHDPAVEAALQERGAGQLLPTEIRHDMEQELGVSLANARIHTDAVAAQAAHALGADAFTIGEDIFFAEDMFAPDTRSGRKLLAHELTHVAQSLRGDTGLEGDGLRVSQPGDLLEREADSVAERISVSSPSRPVFDSEVGAIEPEAGSMRRTMPRTVQHHDRAATNIIYRQVPPRPATLPTIITLQEFIDIVSRVEAANPGKTALEIARMISRTKYRDSAWDWLLPSLVGVPGVAAGGGVTASDRTALWYKLRVRLPQGGEEDPLHMVVAIVANAETLAPGTGGAGGTAARLVQNLPAGVSQTDVAGWAGDVGHAAAEWMTAHPHPKGGTTKETYMDEYASEWDLLGDVDGVAITSTSGSFTFDPALPLSQNLTRFYFPTGAREGKNRRFHIFCNVEGFALNPDGISLSPSASTTIDTRVDRFARWFFANNPAILLWVTINSSSLPTMGSPYSLGMPGMSGMPNLGNPGVMRAWIDRANDWQWFSRRFQDFLQRNLSSEGA